MWTLAALGLIVGSPLQQGVTLVPATESPFGTRDTKFDFLPQALVIESKETQKPGIFLAQAEGIDPSTYQIAQKDLQGLSVAMLVRKNPDKTFTSWTAAGDPFAVDKGEIPQPVQDQMKAGVIALYLRMPMQKPSLGRTLFEVSRDWNRSISANGKVMKLWTLLSVGTLKFVDVKFTAEARLDVGKMKAAPGSESKVDGIDFEVMKQEMPNKGDGQECRCVLQKTKGTNQYLMKVEPDWDAIQKALPNQLEFSSSTSSWIPPTPSKGIPPGSTEIFVSSTVPKQFWKEIVVMKQISLTGFIGHLPTAPNVPSGN